MIGITLPFQFRKAHKEINTDHAVVGTEGCRDIHFSSVSPAEMFSTSQVRGKDAKAEKMLKFIYAETVSKMAILHHAIEFGRLMVITPP